MQVMYQSTRGKGEPVTASQAILKGLSEDGGLLVPTQLPALGVAMLSQMTWDTQFGAFLFLGFALAAFLNVSTIGAAIFGVVFAVLYFMLSGNMGHVAAVNSDESEELQAWEKKRN